MDIRQMTHGIDMQTSSDLGKAEWRTLPWQYFDKDSLQYLFDLGFDVANCLEKSRLSDGARADVASLAMDTFSVLDKLNEWYMEHLSWRQLRRTDLSDTTLDATAGSTAIVGELTNFADIAEASCFVYYWWFQLLLIKSLPALPRSSEDGFTEHGGVQESTTASLSRSTELLAANIVGASPYLLADETGWIGPQRLLVPLRHAMQHLASMQSPVFLDAKACFMRALAKLRPKC